MTGPVTRLILHIGQTKTGSTAIQHALDAVGEPLSSHGILYDTGLNQHNHEQWISPLIPVEKRRGRRSFEAVPSAMEGVRPRLADHHTFIASAENMFRLDPARVMGFWTDYLPGLREVHVIAYLRHPASHYASRVQQILRRSDDVVPMRQYRDDRYLTLIDQWARQGGIASLTVRRFHRDGLVGGSSVSDFRHCLQAQGVALPELPETNANDSLSGAQIVLITRLRAALETDKANGQVDRLVRTLIKINTAIGVPDKFRIRRPYLDLIAHWQRDNLMQLRDRHSVDLLDDHPVPEDFNPASVEPTRDLARLMEPVDEDILQDWQSLVPAFNPALADGLTRTTPAALERIARRTAPSAHALSVALGHLSRWWRQERCQRAAEELESAMDLGRGGSAMAARADGRAADPAGQAA